MTISNQEPDVQLPEKLEFIDNDTGSKFAVDSSDFSVDETTEDSVTFSGDISGHGTVSFVVFPEDGFPINPPADVTVINSESGHSLELQQSTIGEISITMPEDLEDINEDDY